MDSDSVNVTDLTAALGSDGTVSGQLTLSSSPANAWLDVYSRVAFPDEWVKPNPVQGKLQYVAPEEDAAPYMAAVQHAIEEANTAYREIVIPAREAAAAKQAEIERRAAEFTRAARAALGI
jgi:hypothetical protein